MRMTPAQPLQLAHRRPQVPSHRHVVTRPPRRAPVPLRTDAPTKQLLLAPPSAGSGTPPLRLQGSYKSDMLTSQPGSNAPPLLPLHHSQGAGLMDRKANEDSSWPSVVPDSALIPPSPWNWRIKTKQGSDAIGFCYFLSCGVRREEDRSAGAKRRKRKAGGSDWSQ